MPKVGARKNKEIELAQQAMYDEDAAVAFWERHRWGDCPACVRCGSIDVYKINNDARRRWRCRSCSRMYTVKVGTVMQDSNIPLRFWTMALHLMTCSKKGFAAKQLQRMSGLSYKSSLFLANRIRFAMADEPHEMLLGTVEVDEAYIGGKPRPASKQARERAAAEGKELPKSKRGRGTTKTPVVAIVQRGGKAYASPVATVNAQTLKLAVETYAHRTVRVVTDSLNLYNGIGEGFRGGHYSVNHTVKEYARVEPDGFVAHTNTVEGFFSLLQRGIIGIYHSVSPLHLHRYVSEAAFRYTHRFVDDGQRMIVLVKRIEGKKLPNRHSAAL
ncbi:MAG TPA: IS1595 family transposase [Longimicrobium sp.]|nr:IS1595 family transposase [Longimicrobium sp.]